MQQLTFVSISPGDTKISLGSISRRANAGCGYAYLNFY